MKRRKVSNRGELDAGNWMQDARGKSQTQGAKRRVQRSTVHGLGTMSDGNNYRIERHAAGMMQRAAGSEPVARCRAHAVGMSYGACHMT